MSPFLGTNLIDTYWSWYKSIKSSHWWRFYIWSDKNNFGFQTPFGLLHKYRNYKNK